MSSATSISLGEFRGDCSNYIEMVKQGKGRLVVTTHGKPTCAIVSLADLHELESIKKEAPMRTTVQHVVGHLRHKEAQLPFEGELVVDRSGPIWKWEVAVENPASAMRKIAFAGGEVSIETDHGHGKGLLSNVNLTTSLILGSGPWNEPVKQESAPRKRLPGSL